MIEEFKQDSLVDRKKKKAKKSKMISEGTEDLKKVTPEKVETMDAGLKEPKKEKVKKRKKSETGEESEPAKDKEEAKKEKKAKFSISLSGDSCEAPIKAKKPFWRPNKGPKVIIANGEKGETLAKQKKREKDKKRKKKSANSSEEPQIHETKGQNKALRYLAIWAEDRQNWKFEKCRQIWLLQDPTDEYLEGMMNEAPGPINFTMFLTLFGERLQGTDPEEVIKNAFGCFDEENVGMITEDRLRELLTTIGDRFTDDEVDEMYREAPIKNGMFDYLEFTRILKHGAQEKDEA